MDTRNATLMALDVHDIQSSLRGQKVINGLMSSKGGKLYRTARGRMAIQIAPEAFERMKAQLKVTLVEGWDGTRLVTLNEEKAA
jgi:hypothetical protein